jgi:hypothetical protein
MATSMLMLDDATEIGGCLYFIAGSHKLGHVPAVLDDKTTSYKLWKIPTPRMIEIMEQCGDPVPITGKAGTVVLFQQCPARVRPQHVAAFALARLHGLQSRRQPSGTR